MSRSVKSCTSADLHAVVGPSAPKLDAAVLERSLRFAPPPDVEHKNVKGGVLARACVLPHKSSFRITLRGCRVVKVRDSGASSAGGKTPGKTLVIKAGKNVVDALMRLDDFAVTTVKSSAEGWLLRDVQGDTVEELYRESVVHDVRHGVLVRTTVEGGGVGAAIPSAEEFVAAGPLDLTLRLVGLRFMRQYLTLVWRYEHATASSDEDAQQPADDCLFAEEEEEGVVEAATDGPDMEVIGEIRNALAQRLDALRDSVESMRARLSAALPHDVAVLEEVQGELSSVLLTSA